MGFHYFRKAKFILDTYQPMLERLRLNIDKFDLASLQTLAAKSAVRYALLSHNSALINNVLII